MEKLYRLFDSVNVSVEMPDKPIFEVTLKNDDVPKFVQCMLNSKRYMTITLKAKDGEPEDAGKH